MPLEAPPVPPPRGGPPPDPVMVPDPPYTPPTKKARETPKAKAKAKAEKAADPPKPAKATVVKSASSNIVKAKKVAKAITHRGPQSFVIDP